MCATTYLKAALISLPAHARTEQRSSCIMISVVLSVKMKIVMQKKKNLSQNFVNHIAIVISVKIITIGFSFIISCNPKQVQHIPLSLRDTTLIIAAYDFLLGAA